MMKFLVRIVDILLAVSCLLPFFVLGALWALVNRFCLKKPSLDNPQVMLTILSGSHKVNLKRNVQFIYEASPLNGYFQHCYFIYYLADEPDTISYSDKITIFDFRSMKSTKLKTFHFLFLSWIFQEVLFLIFSYRLIRKKGVTLIQANDPYIQGLHALLLSFATKVPYVVKIMCDYDHYFQKFKRPSFPILRYRWIEKGIERLVYYFADGITAWNENYMHYAFQSGARKEISVIVPTLVDIRFFEGNTDDTLSLVPFSLKEHPVLFYLGRMSWDKYCLDLIDCLEQVVKIHPEVKLVVLGDGELRKEFESKAREKGVWENIYLPGIQTVAQIIAWVRASKAMLATHAGFSLIEMGALGIPVVAYDYEWHPEMIKDGETGLLIPFRNTEAMARAVVEILENPSQAEKMAKRLQQLVFAQHHPEIVQKKMADYFHLLQKRQREKNFPLAQKYYERNPTELP